MASLLSPVSSLCGVAGQMDLDTILADLAVTRRPGIFAFVRLPDPVEVDDGIHALVREAEGVTVVTTIEAARERGWEWDFEAAWLTVEVHSALEAVGLTAAVAEALSAETIPCNVLAGYYHDHLLVPVARADEAIGAIRRLRAG